MKIGVFGGTFDPPHIGHLILALEAQLQLNLNKVIWVLTEHPPHKTHQKITPLNDRLMMLRAALKGNPDFELSRVDIDRPPPHYAVDTMYLLKSQYANDELSYLLGGDSLNDLPTWHQPQQFVAACDRFGVMCRPGEKIELSELEKLLPGLSAKVVIIQAPRLEISSSRLRQMIAEGRSIRYYVPPGVERVIQKRNIYRAI